MSGGAGGACARACSVRTWLRNVIGRGARMSCGADTPTVRFPTLSPVENGSAMMSAAVTMKTNVMIQTRANCPNPDSRGFPGSSMGGSISARREGQASSSGLFRQQFADDFADELAVGLAFGVGGEQFHHRADLLGGGGAGFCDGGLRHFHQLV